MFKYDLINVNFDLVQEIMILNTFKCINEIKLGMKNFVLRTRGKKQFVLK